MQAVILAAGMGKRLGRYTKDAPKCMVKVNGKSLIEYAISSILKNGIKRIVIVTGYKKDVLKNFLAQKFSDALLSGAKIEYIDNDFYETTNNIYSLYLARNELVKDDTLFFESDLIFKEKIVRRLIKNENPDMAVVSHFESWMDGTCTVLDEDGSILSVLDKNAFNWNDTASYYKTVNIYKFSREFAIRYYLPFLEAYQKAFGKNEYYEQVLKVLSFLSAGVLKALIADSNDWYEIDDAADLANAEIRFKSGEEKYKALCARYGGFWRFPKLKDFCYLVNPYFPPEKMISELQKSFHSLLTQYPSGSAQQSLLAAKIFSLEPSAIALANGAAELIKAVMKTLDGKRVGILYPTFIEYPECLSEKQIVPIKVNADFSYSFATISEQLTEEIEAIVLINPDNPSGNFLKKDEVFALLEETKKRNIALIFDESFIDFADEKVRYTLLDENVLQKFPNLIVIKSISKSYGVPGLRLGVLATSDAEYVKRIKKMNPIWNMNSFAEYFLQIYEKYSKTYVHACNEIAKERARFIKELSSISFLRPFPSQANYVLASLSSKISARSLSALLLEEHDILIKDLSSKKCFEAGNYVRLAVKSEAENNELLCALRKIEEAI